MTPVSKPLPAAEVISARRQLAEEVVDILRKRDSVDAQFWTYSVHVTHPTREAYEIGATVEGLRLYVDQECPWAVVARESSGSYEEIFVLADGGRVMWLPETGPGRQVGELASVIELYGLWVGTPAELEAHLDELSYP